MKPKILLRTFTRWLLTVLMMTGAAAWVVSVGRAVTWDSPGLRYELGVMTGAFVFGWRPPGWTLAAERFPPRPGWSIARYGGSPQLSWWIETDRNPSWHSIVIPLWMPVVLFGIPAALVWYLDRALVRARWQRFLVWLTPKQPKRLRFGVVAAFCVVHVFGVFVLFELFANLYPFFIDHRHDDPVYPIVEFALAFLFWSTPVWGVLWALAYIRALNALFRRQPGFHCQACGYDLAGNVSGVCPECGLQITDSHGSGGTSEGMGA